MRLRVFESAEPRVVAGRFFVVVSVFIFGRRQTFL